MVVETPFSNLGGTAANFNIGAVSGAAPNTSSTSGLVEQDWYVHTQSVRCMYVLEQGYDKAISGVVIGAPIVTHNYLNGHFTVETSDRVLSSFAFSGSDLQPHHLRINSFAPSGGLGVSGIIETSTLGMVRRKVRTDAAGKLQDPIGNCHEQGTLVFARLPGSYDSRFDTSTTINSKLWEVVNHMPDHCETFMPDIVFI